MFLSLEYSCYFTRYWTLLLRTRFRINRSIRNWRSSRSTVTDELISWISYTETDDKHSLFCNSVTDFFRLLSIHLLYDNVLLNNRSELNKYLFSNVILKLEDVELNNVLLKLINTLKISRRCCLVFRFSLSRTIEVHFSVSFMLERFTLLRKELFMSFSFLIKCFMF